MGRPRKTPVDPLAEREVRIGPMVSASDASMCEAAARELGLSVAEWIRGLVLPVAQEQHAESLKEPK